MLKKFKDWIIPSFEGEDGKASFRRLTAFVLIIFESYMVFGDKIPEESRISLYYANLITILLIIGIVTTQNVLEFFNRGNNGRQTE